ncbi:hypothetical protein DID88_006330 [Monilinia fructigena]|uniref:Muniscin C-terminal domain-containing protein n=1 Tax=Monilinia fructigena TaxID=38457 RepID=A0A395J3I4_9HELO|nr:hypothetical protein DID88_006330 [Monilinia fructigena]
MGQESLNASDSIRPATSNGISSPGMVDLSEVEPPAGPPPSHLQEAQKTPKAFRKMNLNSSWIFETSPFLNKMQMHKLHCQMSQYLAFISIGHPRSKGRTVRGRRDVRHTVYVPSPTLEVSNTENNIPPSPALPLAGARGSAIAAISEHGHEMVLQVSLIQTRFVPAILSQIMRKWRRSISQSWREIALAYVSSPNGTSLPASVSTDKPDEFTIDLASISHKTSAAFTYRVHVEDQDMGSYSPLLLKPAWKRANIPPLELSIANPDLTGTHYRDRSSIVWPLGDVTLSHEFQRVTALFSSPEGTTQAINPDHAEGRWEVHSPNVGSGISISRLEGARGVEESDPFADESVAPTTGNWVNVENKQEDCYCSWNVFGKRWYSIKYCVGIRTLGVEDGKEFFLRIVLDGLSVVKKRFKSSMGCRWELCRVEV